jgi:mRNA interferase MazF
MIVISNDAYHSDTQDFVGVAMTSNMKVEPYSFVITSSDLIEGSLNRPGHVRADKIFTLSQSIIVVRFGRVNGMVLDEIRKRFDKLIARLACDVLQFSLP